MKRVTGDTHVQTAALENLADAVRYRRWLADLARPYLGPHPIEIGSGTGDYALEWADQVATFTATEAEPDRFEALRDRFEGHPVIQTLQLHLGADDLTAQRDQYTGAVSYNVFEHIPDHVEAMRALATLVQPGGAIAIIVPAFPSAMSRFDITIGHQRRYTVASARAMLTEAGLEVHTVRYVNPIGLLAWYVMVKALNVPPHNGFGLRLYDRTVVPLAAKLDTLVPAPFGQSVFAVARVP